MNPFFGIFLILCYACAYVLMTYALIARAAETGQLEQHRKAYLFDSWCLLFMSMLVVTQVVDNVPWVFGTLFAFASSIIIFLSQYRREGEAFNLSVDEKITKSLPGSNQ